MNMMKFNFQIIIIIFFSDNSLRMISLKFFFLIYLLEDIIKDLGFDFIDFYKI